MKRTLVGVVLAALVLGGSGVGWTEEQRPSTGGSAAVAPATDAKEAHDGGCMPGGGCCGAAACKQAAKAASEGGKSDATSAGGGCPCGKAKRAP